MNRNYNANRGTADERHAGMILVDTDNEGSGSLMCTITTWLFLVFLLVVGVIYTVKVVINDIESAIDNM
jgi:hypothetical protein